MYMDIHLPVIYPSLLLRRPVAIAPGR